MARSSKTAEVVEMTPKPVAPVIPKICASCAEWAPLPNDPVLGECIPSKRAQPRPLVTTDQTTCSRWRLNGAKFAAFPHITN